jgi:hypothetical protein
MSSTPREEELTEVFHLKTGDHQNEVEHLTKPNGG